MMLMMMNPFDECYDSMNKDSTMHRVTVDTPEDVFLDTNKNVNSVISNKIATNSTDQLSV